MRSTFVVSGTTCTRLSAWLAALLLTTMAGRVFLASPPTEGSNAIHQTSPRRGSAAIAYRVGQKIVDPCRCFRFLLGIGRHLAIACQQRRLGHEWLSEV